MSRAELVREAILTQLRLVDGTSPRNGTSGAAFVWNLAANEGQVKSGKYSRPPASPPFACCWLDRIDESFGPTLDERQQIGSFVVLGFAGNFPKDPAARQRAAEDLLNDIRGALRRSPRLGGTVDHFTASAAAWENAAAQGTEQASYGTAAIAITATWRER